MANPTYFAEIDANGIVLRVVEADQDFINSGKLGNPANFVQTWPDGSARKNYAGVGHTYDRLNDQFIAPKPFPSWTLDPKTARWQAPIPQPAGKLTDWNEALQQWQASTSQGVIAP